MSTFPHELQEAILHLRQLHPGWGPATLLLALKTDPRWYDRPLPSRARIAALLKHAGLARLYQPQHDLQQPLVHHRARFTKNGRWIRHPYHVGERGGRGEFDHDC